MLVQRIDSGCSSGKSNPSFILMKLTFGIEHELLIRILGPKKWHLPRALTSSSATAKTTLSRTVVQGCLAARTPCWRTGLEDLPGPVQSAWTMQTRGYTALFQTVDRMVSPPFL